MHHFDIVHMILSSLVHGLVYVTCPPLAVPS